MKPSTRERAALQRKPISPDHQRYEAEKRKWLAENPTAMQEEYDRAVRAIAKRCGI